MDKDKRIKALEDESFIDSFSEKARKRLNSILIGDNPEVEQRMLAGKMNPMDVMSITGRGYDSVVGAPTRSALKAGYEGENPLAAAASQFGENPDTAPDFGMVGNALADPFIIAGAAKGAGKIGLEMAEAAPRFLSNELGAVGKDISKLKGAKVLSLPGNDLPRIGIDNRGGQILDKKAASLLKKNPVELSEVDAPTKFGDIAEGLRARFSGSDKEKNLEKVLSKIEKSGDTLPPYVDLNLGKGKEQFPIPNANFSIKNATLGNPITQEVKYIDDPLNWYDDKYGVVKEAIASHQGPININTAQDLIARDDYLQSLPAGSKVNFYYNSGNNFGSASKTSASFNRLKTAAEKLKQNGYKVDLIDINESKVLPLNNAKFSSGFESATDIPQKLSPEQLRNRLKVLSD